MCVCVLLVYLRALGIEHDDPGILGGNFTLKGRGFKSHTRLWPQSPGDESVQGLGFGPQNRLQRYRVLKGGAFMFRVFGIRVVLGDLGLHTTGPE